MDVALALAAAFFFALGLVLQEKSASAQPAESVATGFLVRLAHDRIWLLGLAMRRYGFPTAPVIVGMILGPMAEKQLRNALSISQGDWSVFATRPICLVLLVVIVCILVLPRLLRKRVPLAG